MAGIVGLEPTALELTVLYSTIELYANFEGLPTPLADLFIVCSVHRLFNHFK